MYVVTGKPILNGIAIGPLRVYKKQKTSTVRSSKLSAAAEYARFNAARAAAQEQLADLYDQALAEVGKEQAVIFEIHQMMLDDEDCLNAVKGILETQGTTAEYAVNAIGRRLYTLFAAMKDEYMRARSADVLDTFRRVINILMGVGDAEMMDGGPAILVTDYLFPSEAMRLDKSKLLGFITRYGSAKSHAAILARTMRIPSLAGVDFRDDWDGRLAVIDGYNHCVYIDPSPELLAVMEEKRASGLKREA